MERHEFETVLDAKLDPLKDAIEKLELNYEKVVELLTAQAVHEEGMKRVKEDITVLYNRVREIEKDAGGKIWDTAKTLGWALLGLLLGGLVASKF